VSADRIYFDWADEDRDGKGWNVVDDEHGGAIALRFATYGEAAAYVAEEEGSA
jgi:hypothetical protein